MFSPAQWYFAIGFAILFIGIITLSYKKDRLLHKKYYKGSHWVLIGFIVFIILLFLLKKWLKG